MGLIFIPNQNVSFVFQGESDFNARNYECKLDDTEFCQIVSAEDPTQFQVKVTPDTGTELLTNGDFSSGLTGWTTAGGWGASVVGGINVAAGLAFSGFPVDLTQAAAFAATAGDAFRVVIDMLQYEVDGEAGFYVDFLDSGGNPAGNITGVGNSSTPITTEGTYTLTFESGVTDNIDIVLTVFSTAVTFNLARVNSVSVMAVTLPEVTLQDCDGNTVDTITDIEYAAEYATITVDWSNYTPDCYKICVFPEQDTGKNLFNLCMVDEFGQPLLDENEDCLESRI